MSLDQIQAACKGQIISQRSTLFSGVGTDSRSDLKAKIFIALKGDNFDGHDYLTQAKQQGATAFIVDKLDDDMKSKLSDVTVVLVADTLLALQNLAFFWRTENAFKVIAISGSNGKTTTKSFTQTLLSEKFKVHASPGSFNNHWGVPLSILGADPDIEVLVLEMGMNHRGELRRLCEIARPDVVGLTMVGSSHIGELGSMDALVAAKKELYDSCPSAFHIYNVDNEHTIFMYEKNRMRKIRNYTFSSFKKEVDVHLRITRMNMTEIEVTGHIQSIEGSARIPIFGRQNVSNLMFAATAAVHFGLEPNVIWNSFQNCRTSWGRNQLIAESKSAQILFDAYNANPESMEALLKNIYEISNTGKKVAILGEMLELGAEAPSAHKSLGLLSAKVNLDIIWFIGQHKLEFEAGLKAGKFEKNYYLSNTYEQSLAMKIRSVLNQSDIVVIKGSRGIKLEQVLADLQS